MVSPRTSPSGSTSEENLRPFLFRWLWPTPSVLNRIGRDFAKCWSRRIGQQTTLSARRCSRAANGTGQHFRIGGRKRCGLQKQIRKKSFVLASLFPRGAGTQKVRN